MVSEGQNINTGLSAVNGGESPPLVIFCYNCEQKLDATNLPAFSVVNCPSCQAPLIVPRWFDSYLLEEIVGEGGMATVYRALDLALDREVAIKIMSVTGDTDADFHTLFLEEARTAATINHQAVVAIYTCSVAEEKPYIVMEFMGGGSLEKVLEEKKEPLDILQVCQWMQDIAEGLERAEKYGIIHHDIKPANIMLDLEGNVKIGDFGIAQRRFDQAASSGGSENLWGSPFYVSPEKARDGVESFPGDIYSLGATFYHLLTGVPPFNGYENIEELVYVRIEKDPPLPSAIRREIPSEVDALIMKMMHRDPEKRPTYPFVAAELAKIIKKYKSGAFFHAVAVSAKKGINLPPAANDTGFYPITAEQEKNKAAAAEDPENRTGNTPAEKGKMEKKKRRSAGYVTMLVAASIAGAAGIFFILYVLFRFMFSSMKG